MRLLVVLTAVVTTLALPGCCRSEPAGVPAPVQVGVAQSGTTVQIPVGGTLAVALPANPSTGYIWAVACSPAPVLVEAGKPEIVIDQPGVPGSGGTQTTTYTVAQAGTATLALAYRRSFEPASVPAVRTFTITVQAVAR